MTIALLLGLGLAALAFARRPAGSGAGNLSGDPVAWIMPYIRGWEGFSAHPYADYEQTSIGYGSRYRPHHPVPMPEDYARRLLETELRGTYLPELLTILQRAGIDTKSVPVNRIGACLSFIYNLGGGNTANASWPRAWARGDMNAAKRSWLAHRLAGGQVNPGLVRRRAEEWELFEKGHI